MSSNQNACFSNKNFNGNFNYAEQAPKTLRLTPLISMKAIDKICMIQQISFEQTFVINLEKFLSKADKFIKIYYAGVSEQEHIKEIMCEVRLLALDVDLEQLEIEYQLHCDKNDLIADCDDSAWF